MKALALAILLLLPGAQAAEAEKFMPTIAEQIIDAAQRHGVDPRLAVEVGIAESGLNQSLVSTAGAIGIMQLMPATATELGVDPHDAAQNIEGGVRYLKQQLDRFAAWDKALAAYNWGPNSVAASVQENGPIWLSFAPRETQDYVAKILGNLQSAQTGTVATIAKVQQATEMFRGLNKSQQTLLLLAVAGGGIYLLSEWFDDA